MATGGEDVLRPRPCRTWGFREYFRVGSDADLQVLRPQSLGDEHVLDLHGRGRAGHQVAERTPEGVDELLPHRGRARGVALGAFLDHPLEQAPHECHAGGLDDLEVDRGKQVQCGVVAVSTGSRDLGDRPPSPAGCRANDIHQVIAVQQR